MDPVQLALKYKDALNATKAFVVQPDGRVKMSADRGGGYAPPWVWAGAIPEASGNDAQSQALRIKLSTPASDPSSPWHDMYSGGGPFTKHSAWDSEEGSYDGGIDWGTLLGTIGVGSMFAAPALAAGLGGGGGAAAAPTLEASMNAGVGSTVAPTAAATTAGSSGMGTVSSILDTVKKGSDAYTGLSDVLGGAAKSSNQQNNIADQLRLLLYGQQNNAQLNAKKFALDAPSTRMSTALKAVLPNYASRTKVNWGGPGSGLRGEVPTFSGGPADTMMAAGKDPGYSKLRDQVLQDEITSQMKGGSSGGNEDAQTTAAPQVGETSALDKGLGGGALITGILGALSKMKKPNTMTPGQPWTPPEDALSY